MDGRATAILLMLSLAVLLLVGAGAADDMIRLPSSAMEETDQACCKETRCTKLKAMCYCADEFESKDCRGVGTCGNCRPVRGSDPVRYVCADVTKGRAPLPNCD